MIKIVLRILNVMLFILVPLVVFVLITSKSSLIGNIRSFVVLSGSMEPTIPVGSVIITTKHTTYDKGDIIAFDRGDETVTHRIVTRTMHNGSIYYTTRGDANNIQDQNEVPQSRVFGKEQLFIPFIGRLILFIRSVPGFLLFVILPGLLFIGYEVKTIKEEMEKDIEKKVLAKMEEKK